MEEKLNSLIRYLILKELRENVQMQMMDEMSKRQFDKTTPPELAPLFTTIAMEAALTLKGLGDMIDFKFEEIDKKVKAEAAAEAEAEEKEGSN